MPELPEVETVVRTIAPHVVGRRIVAAHFGSKFVTPGDRNALAAKLSGRGISQVTRRGKFIWIHLDCGNLAVHLGMTGKLLFNGASGPHTHGHFELDEGLLLYDDIRQFGRIEWSDGVPERIAALGPEPLEIGEGEFVARFKARSTRAKPLLLDQSFLAGLGNIYVDEALFRARIHPKSTASHVGPARVRALHGAIVELLTAAIAMKGSSISDYVDADGKRGGFQEMHQVYGKEGEPCVRCGARIKRIVVGQRGTHFCPKCQR
jgi:formamidopyrimidine-DNA glycosylase